MKSITIEGQLRTESGKKATRQLRSQQLVPAVIYGGQKEVSFSAPAASFKSIVYTSEFKLAEIKVEGKSYRCILKDLQFDKLEGKIVTDKLQIDKDDRTSGIRSTNYETAERLIKNTYKTLMTRGQRGCYIYCEDKNLRDHIKNFLI